MSLCHSSARACLAVSAISDATFTSAASNRHHVYARSLAGGIDGGPLRERLYLDLPLGLHEQATTFSITAKSRAP